jgi:hypothetical protein
MKSLSKHVSLGLLAVAVVGFSSCSSKMSKNDCEKADFYEIGLKDGKAGKSIDRLKEITAMCSDSGVTVQESKYTYGRQVGLASFCDDGRAKSDAKSGRTDSLCMQEKIPPYMTAYSRYVEKTKLEKAEDLKKLQARKDKLQAEQDKLQADLNNINALQQATPADQSAQPTQL